MARPGPVGGQYQPLTGEQLGRIHGASLAVLERTGIQVQNRRALDLYCRAGAEVDGTRVYISPAMVESALASVPSRVLLAGRDPAQDLLLEGKRVYAGTGGSPTMVLDPGAETVRPGTLRDLADLARIADALEHCDFITIPLHPTDVPSDFGPVNRFYTCLANSTKHVMSNVQTDAGSVAGVAQVVDLAAMIAGGLEALRARPQPAP